MRKILILIFIYPAIISFAQVHSTLIEKSDNHLSYKINFKNLSPEKISLNGKIFLSFKGLTLEEEEGKPLLPFSTILIAVPPNSSIEINLKEQEYFKYENVEPLNGYKLSLVDERIDYQTSEPNTKFYHTDVHPFQEYEVVGYTWLRNYYCAIVNIYTHRYYWKLKEINELLSAKIEINFKNNYSPTNTNRIESEFDQSLKEIIFNYNEAENFKSTSPSYSLTDTTGNWIDYNNEYVKLGIPTDGLYRITYDMLVGYGVSPQQINPKSLKIFSKGKEIPLRVFGEDDLTFDTTDYIEFYMTRNYDSSGYRSIVSIGSDYINYLNRYTDTSAIFLTWGGNNGLRFPFFNGTQLTATDTITAHKAFIHLERDVRLWYYDNITTRINMPQWQENKVWTWLTIGKGTTRNTTFSVSNVVPNTIFKSYVRMISNASNISNNAHLIGIAFNNNTVLDSIYFNFKQTVNLFSSHFSGRLQNGNNQLRLIGLNTDASFYTVLVDWMEVEYYRYNYLSSDSLFIRIPDSVSQGVRGIRVYSATGSTGDYLIYKLNDGAKFINTFNHVSNSIIFYDTVKGGDNYIIIKNNRLKSPLFYYKKQFVNLRNPERGADYIIISNKILQQSVTQYKNFIDANYSLRNELVYVDDIYDEFGYGNPEAEAIKRFLMKAYDTWVQPAPSYLMLIGDANYDYKDVITELAFRRKNLVPSYGNPVSDAWFVMWDNVNPFFQQMNVGRIAARNDEEVMLYLSKHQAYLTRPYDDWNKRYLLFSGGDPNKLSEMLEIRNTQQNLFNNLILPAPTGGTGRHFYKTVNPNTNFGPYTPEEIQNSIDSGGVFISYIGHSGTQTWDNGITRVQDVQNIFGDRKPLITDFGCSTGRFGEPDIECFAEMFTTSESQGQAISYAGNSSFGFLSTSLRFPGYFYSTFLTDTIKQIGLVHNLSKVKQINLTGLSDVNKVFSYCNVLFGDPLISLAVPPKPNLFVDGNSISFSTNTPSDQDDTLYVEIKLRNYGRVIPDSFSVVLQDVFSDTIYFKKEIREEIPLFNNIIEIAVPIKDKPGEHLFTIIVDPHNEIDEIYENDNQVTLSVNVFSTSLFTLHKENYYLPLQDTVIILNPFYRVESLPEKGVIEIADNPQFQNSVLIQKDFDSLITIMNLNLPKNSPRYYWRTKVDHPSIEWSEIFSFSSNHAQFDWFIDSTFRANDLASENIIFNDSTKKWELGKKSNTLTIKSAGQSAGSFVAFDYNLVQLAPNTFFWGIVTALIDTITLRPYNFKYFVYPTPPAADSLISYINSLPDEAVLALAVCDDAQQSVLGTANSPVRQVIRTLGSYYIDSVQYRESWCMIGKKGLPIGSALEAYKKQFQGPATIDTSITVAYSDGSILFPLISKSTSWDKAIVNVEIPEGSNLEFFPVGFKSDGQIDTLGILNLNDNTIDLNEIDAGEYPAIKLGAKFTLSEDYKSPSISNLGVLYLSKPELAMNYQTIFTDKDSVDFNDSIKLKFMFANVGETKAENFKVNVFLIRTDNSERILLDSLIESLEVFEKKEYILYYKNDSTDNPGNMAFKILLDPENDVDEFVELNNTYSISFYTKADTNVTSIRLAYVDVMFDGNLIFEGDYTSNNPIIKMEIKYGSRFPISDTNSVRIYLDNIPVYYSQLEIDHDTANRKMIYTYSPILTDGEHFLRVIGENLIGNLESATGYQVSFNVSSKLSFIDAYNYPNPFRDKTYFTFRLPQLPEELYIKIYTIAGRLIREINVDVSLLKNEFNTVEWDGRDADGDLVANGIYLYKAVLKKNNEISTVTNKIAVIR